MWWIHKLAVSRHLTVYGKLITFSLNTIRGYELESAFLRHHCGYDRARYARGACRVPAGKQKIVAAFAEEIRATTMPASGLAARSLVESFARP
jgi:hypothetical protein